MYRKIHREKFQVIASGATLVLLAGLSIQPEAVASPVGLTTVLSNDFESTAVGATPSGWSNVYVTDVDRVGDPIGKSIVVAPANTDPVAEQTLVYTDNAYSSEFQASQDSSFRLKFDMCFGAADSFSTNWGILQLRNESGSNYSIRLENSTEPAFTASANGTSVFTATYNWAGTPAAPQVGPLHTVVLERDATDGTMSLYANLANDTQTLIASGASATDITRLQQIRLIKREGGRTAAGAPKYIGRLYDEIQVEVAVP